MTSQKPSPPSAAPQNFSSDRYLPRRTPSTSKPPSFTLRTACFWNCSRRASMWVARGFSIGPPLGDTIKTWCPLLSGGDTMFLWCPLASYLHRGAGWNGRQALGDPAAGGGLAQAARNRYLPGWRASTSIPRLVVVQAGTAAPQTVPHHVGHP